ncbi:hypothetical protein BO79DRAFT_125756, partial [Aspergillus costaricaensis CBS 115574]
MSYRKVSPLDPVDCKEELELVGELEDKVSGLQREMEQPLVVARKEMEAITEEGKREVKMLVTTAVQELDQMMLFVSVRPHMKYTRYGTGANNDLGRDSPYLNIAECIHQCSQLPKCRMVYFHKGLRTCFFATRPGTLSGRAPDYDAAWFLG